MRQRYYNAEIKRFVNQDILAGSLDNSQSLNRYSYVQGNPVSYTDPFGLSPINGLFSDTNFAHALLGVLGCVPGKIGLVASIVDALVYAIVDKDIGMAVLSAVDAVAIGSAAKAAKSARMARLADSASDMAKLAKQARTAQYVNVSCRLASNCVNFAMNGAMTLQNASDMYDKYYVQKQGFGNETYGELAILGLDLLGTFASFGEGIHNVNQLGKMMKADGITGRLKQAVTAFAGDNRGMVDLNAFRGGSKSRRLQEAIVNHVPKKGDVINIRNIYNELNKSEVGRETLDYLMRNDDITINFYYHLHPNEDGLLGRIVGRNIDIYVPAHPTNTKVNVAKTLIHETTHAFIGSLRNTRKEEVICFIRMVLHDNNGITSRQIKEIIREVNSLYAELPWR